MLRPILAALLTLLHAGVGQIYNGQRWKGIALILCVFLGTSLKNVITIAPIILLYLIALVDAIWVAVKINRGAKSGLDGKRAGIEVLVALVISMPITYTINEFTAGEMMILPSDDKMSKIPKQEENKVKKEAEAYLKEKYHRDFTVSDVKYVWQTNEYAMTAKGEGSLQVKFEVYRKKSSGEHSDTLLASMWRQQSHQELKPVIERSFPKHMSFSSSVGYDSSVLEQIEIQDLPSFKKLRSQTDDYTVKIRLYVIKNITAENRDEELGKVLAIVNYLNKQQINTSLQIEFYDEKLLARGVDQITDDNTGDHIDYLRYIFDSTDVSELSTLDDLESVFNEVE